MCLPVTVSLSTSTLLSKIKHKKACTEGNVGGAYAMSVQPTRNTAFPTATNGKFHRWQCKVLGIHHTTQNTKRMEMSTRRRGITRTKRSPPFRGPAEMVKRRRERIMLHTPLNHNQHRQAGHTGMSAHHPTRPCPCPCFPLLLKMKINMNKLYVHEPELSSPPPCLSSRRTHEGTHNTMRHCHEVVGKSSKGAGRW